MGTRIFKLAVSLLMTLGLLVGVAQAWADTPQRMAMGLIVKLKDGSTGAVPVVRLRPAMSPTDTPAHIRSRLAKVAHDRGVSYLVSKPTVFAAQVMHSGHPEPLADAQAKAARLRADPNVEWVMVNELLRPASFVGQPVSATDPAYSSQTWLKSRDVNAGRAAVANIPAAWNLMVGRTLTPVVVAVLDTGILPPRDLDGRVALPGYDFVADLEYANDGNGQDADASDPGDWLTTQTRSANPVLYGDLCKPHDSSWHGLSVSSMLAASTGNGIGGAGILAPLPGAVVLPVRVSGVCGASVSDMIEGMLWAAGVDYQGAPARNLNPARVINLSLGGDGACSDTTVGSAAWVYRQTVQLLNNLGVLVVASAGNGDPDTGLGLPGVTRPANCPGVLAVTGLSQFGYKASYANLVEPSKDYAVAVASGDGDYSVSAERFFLTDDGISVLTNNNTTSPDLDPDNGYQMRAELGTSFASPTAAGVAALMLAVNPNLTVNQLLAALTTQVEAFPATVGARAVCNAGQTNVPSGCLPRCQASDSVFRGRCYCTTSTCGGGILDAERAVQWAIDNIDPHATPYSYANAYASYFTPDRLKPVTAPNTGGGGGGGGGAIDTIGLLALLLAVIVLAVIRIKGGKR